MFERERKRSGDDVTKSRDRGKYEMGWLIESWRREGMASAIMDKEGGPMRKVKRAGEERNKGMMGNLEGGCDVGWRDASREEDWRDRYSGVLEGKVELPVLQTQDSVPSLDEHVTMGRSRDFLTPSGSRDLLGK